MREAVLSLGDSELDTLGIGELVSLAREAGITDFEALTCHGSSAVVQVAVEDRIDEDQLDGLDYVDEWNRVQTATETQLYVIAYTTPEFDDRIAAYADDLVGDCDPELAADGATLSLVGPQDVINGTVGEFESAGASLDLEKLRGYDGDDGDDPLENLTDRQREVVETAFEAGYYEIPRQASTDDVAAELGVDDSTVAEHLQRAERNLLSHHLAD